MKAKRILKRITALVLALLILPIPVALAAWIAPELNLSASYDAETNKVTASVDIGAHDSVGGIGFTLNYDSTKLTYESHELSGVMTGSTVGTTVAGKVGVSGGNSLTTSSVSAGTILKVVFTVNAGQSGNAAFSLSDFDLNDCDETEVSTTTGTHTADAIIPKAPIASVTIADLDAPVKGDAPDTSVTVTPSSLAADVKWFDGATPVTGNFAASTAYTVKIKLTASGGDNFAETVTASGYTVTRNSKTELLLTKTFNPTPDKVLTDLTVTTPPTKTAYVHGDGFAPTGMVVKATYDDGTRNDDFKGYTVEYATVGKGYLCVGHTKVTLKAEGQTVDVTGLTVNQKALTVDGLTAVDREYKPGDTSVTLNGGTLSGVVGSEKVSLVSIPTTGRIGNADVGDNKDVTIDPLSLTGADAGNYTLTQPTGIKVKITPKDISGAVITYGTQNTYNGSEQDVVISKVTVNGKDLGDGTDYTVFSGNKATDVGNNTLVIKGKGNYTGEASATWTLKKATPTAADFTIPTLAAKDYTGSPVTVPAPTSSKNGIGARTVKYAGSTTAPTNAGTYTVTFDVAEGQNYKEATGLSIGTLTINKVTYTGTTTATATVRSGQTTTNATLTLPALPAGASYGTVSTSGALIDGTPTVSGTTLTYSTTNQTDGTSATITIGVTGATNYNNYNVVVTITAKDKEDAGVTIADSTKTVTYGSNVTITASATATGGTWSWSYPSDTFEAVGATDGNSITLKPLKATTGAATITAKYESTTHIGEATASVTVNKKNITITGLSASNKEYDGNTTATVNGTAEIDGKVGSDEVTVTAGSAAFADKTVGDNKTVTFSGYSLSGAAAGNYNLTAQPASVTADITAKSVTITGVTATTRAYVSGNKSVTLTGGTVSGAVSGDTVTVDLTGATGIMENEDAGTDKAVTATGVALGGTDAGNYKLTAQPTGITVTISKATYSGTIATTKNVLTNTAVNGVEVDMTSLLTSIKGAAVSAASESSDIDDIISNVSKDGNKVKFDVASIAASGKNATINVTISSTNYTDITATITVTTVNKSDAGVSISGVPTSKTYGDADFNLTASTTTPGTNGTWKWVSGDSTVLQVTGSGAAATVKVLKAGSATITAKYESDTTMGEQTTAAITVGKRVITVTADNKSMTVNGTLPTFTVTYGNLPSGVQAEDIFETLASASTTADGKTTGSFDITVTTPVLKTEAEANYEVGAVTKGTLTVNPRSSSGGGGGGSYTPSYSITVDKTENGTITVSPKSASKGDTVTITVKPDKGYELEMLKALDKDGDALKLTEKNGKYTFKMPSGKVTVKGSFAKEAPEQIFADVPVDAYYYEAVKWAAEKGITGGVGSNLFAPNQPCTRAQIVTFLWRAAGSPEPKTMSSFADVPADAYYAKAVAWAVEQGITAGTSATTFAPDAACTRAQCVTFLYRAAGSPAVSGGAAFTDVASDAYYAKAVKWAQANGITTGIGGGLFGSNNNCTRAQIVTFIYRYMEK